MRDGPKKQSRPPATPSGHEEADPRLIAGTAVAFIVATWGALYISQSLSETDATERDAPIADVAGFSRDAWFLPDDDLLGFVEIPAGPFVMGSDPAVDSLAFELEAWGAGRVQGIVELPVFFIGRYEVTVAQFARFARSAGYRPVEEATLHQPLDHPVTSVTWTDALAYTRWLDATLRESESTPPELARRLEEGWRVSLPTEAQWEKAARGGDARIYPWGNEPSADHANFRSRGTTPVGSFDCPGCAHGLADMSGNVWEFTRSPYQPYPYDASDDADDIESAALWVMRGGSFGDPEQHIRVANRGGVDPGARETFIGFRLVISRPGSG